MHILLSFNLLWRLFLRHDQAWIDFDFIYAGFRERAQVVLLLVVAVADVLA